MKQSRKLVLRSQHVTDLASDELAAVVGGTHVGCGVTHGMTCEVECGVISDPLNECLPAVVSIPIRDCLVATGSGCTPQAG